MINKRKLDLYRVQYIRWNEEAIKINLKIAEFDELYEKICSSHFELRCRSKCKRDEWTRALGTWRYDINRNTNIKYIYYRKDFTEYYIYSCNYFDDNKNNHQIAEKSMHLNNGNIKSSTTFNEDFYKEYNKTMKKAYGTVEEEYKLYVPHQFYYNINDDKLLKTTRIIKDVHSLDFSSMYPSNACGKMPDAHTAYLINKYVKPDDVFQFAFYPDTGHIAIYDEFDTHDWIGSQLENYLFREEQHIHNKDTKTILMKASSVKMDSLWNRYYELRKIDENAKLKMNSTIGKWHRKDYKRDKYAHLAAVVIARANNKMLQVSKQVKFFNIIQICVDGMIYKGNTILGNNESKLGNIKKEFEHSDICYKGQNQYIVMKDNEVIKVKAGGYNDMNGLPINETTVKSFDDMNKWNRKITKTEKQTKENE